MTIPYRRHSGSSPNWNRNIAYSSRTPHAMLSPSYNHRASQNPSPAGTTNTPTSPSSYSSALKSEQLKIYPSSSKAMRSPSIPTVSEDPCEQAETKLVQQSSRGEKSNNTDILTKGKDREIVRTRPIFHANLEEAKKYHQQRLKISASKRTPISSEEIICRYCDHFQFQLPVVELDRFKEGGKKRVLLRIKRRLVGIGEGQTTFQAMLAAYDDTVLYLFNDSELKKKLLQPNEVIEWHHKKVSKA